MPIYKSVQYSIWCDFCKNSLLDFETFKNKEESIKYFRQQGYKKVKNKWSCPLCIVKNKKDILQKQ